MLSNSQLQQGLIREEKHEGSDPPYWKTAKFKELCPKIVDVVLPVIDPLVEEYDKQHPS